MATPLPPGPAFIQCRTRYVSDLLMRDLYRIADDVPRSYIWIDATDHSPAGWVRPHGVVDASSSR